MSNQYKRYKNFLEKFLDSSKGKRLFNIVYSVGAAIVIIGAMAKILHWSFGNEMLMIGMITEAVVFLLSAFEKPAKDYKWEEVYPVLSDNDDFISKTERIQQTHQQELTEKTTPSPAIQSTAIPSSKTARMAEGTTQQQASAVSSNTSSSGGAVVIGGNAYSNSSSDNENTTSQPPKSTPNSNPISGNITIVGGHGGLGSSSSSTSISNDEADNLSKIANNMEKFAKATDALTQISESLQKSFSTITENADGIGDNTQNYITQMESLNRNIAGLNTIYEIQLKGVSGQINTIEHINAGLDRIKKLYDGSLADSSIFKNETEKMAQQLSELNRVYSRLLQAMTSNMNIGGGFGTPNNMGNNNSDQP